MNTGMPRGRVKQFPETKLVKLTVEQLEAVRAYAEAHGLTDSEAIRQLIARGLDSKDDTSQVAL